LALAALPPPPPPSLPSAPLGGRAPRISWQELWNPIPGAPGQPNKQDKDAGSGDNDLTKEGQWKDEIARKYTPCSLDCHVGYFDLLIKVRARRFACSTGWRFCLNSVKLCMQ
jgi:hypothetical protein